MNFVKELQKNEFLFEKIGSYIYTIPTLLIASIFGTLFFACTYYDMIDIKAHPECPIDKITFIY